jgi:hypothetical protein
MYVFIQAEQDNIINLYRCLQHPTGEAPQGLYAGIARKGQYKINIYPSRWTASIEIPISKVDGEKMRALPRPVPEKNLYLFFFSVNDKIKLKRFRGSRFRVQGYPELGMRASGSNVSVVKSGLNSEPLF